MWFSTVLSRVWGSTFVMLNAAEPLWAVQGPKRKLPVAERGGEML